MYKQLDFSRGEFDKMRRQLVEGMNRGGLMDNVLLVMKKLQSKWCEFFLVHGETENTIDDDKQNSRSSEWKKDGFAMKKIKKNWGAVFHLAVSTKSGVVLAIHPEKHGENDLACVQSLLRTVFNHNNDAALATYAQKHHPIIYFDRGYNKGN